MKHSHTKRQQQTNTYTLHTHLTKLIQIYLYLYLFETNMLTVRWGKTHTQCKLPKSSVFYSSCIVPCLTCSLMKQTTQLFKFIRGKAVLWFNWSLKCVFPLITGYSDKRMSQFESKRNTENNSCFKHMLHDWERRDIATVTFLIQCLKNIGRDDIARILYIDSTEARTQLLPKQHTLSQSNMVWSKS